MPRRRPASDEIAVVDLFAGPGGLGEGFSSLEHRGQHPFNIVLSAERDPGAQKTLELRAFYRQFRGRCLPQAYTDLLRATGRESDRRREALFAACPTEAAMAREEAERFELSRANRPRLESRLRALKLNRDRTVVIGGPPCQAYSVAGRSRNGAKVGWSLESDSRSRLYREYLHVLAHVQPAAFVMENVRGMLSARLHGESVFELLRNDLHHPRKSLRMSQAGRRYRLFPVAQPRETPQGGLGLSDIAQPEDFLVRAEEHGIPQARHRVIILGVAEELVDGGGPGFISRQATLATVREVLADYPTVRSVISSGADSHARWIGVLEGALGKRRLAGTPAAVREAMADAVHRAALRDPGRGGDYLENPKGEAPVLNHQVRGHMESDLHRYLFASAWAEVHGVSPTIEDFPTALLPDHANIGAAGGSTIFNDRFRVQIWDAPSTTVVSHISKDGHYYIHPDPAQCRSLTVREAARLQTFPDDYFFCGPRTSQFQQVGNAVPVELARMIARVVLRKLR